MGATTDPALWFFFLGSYLIGWVVWGAFFMRQFAEKCVCSTSHYHQEYGHSALGHWKGDGTVGKREIITGALTGAGWPVLLIPIISYGLATGVPTKRSFLDPQLIKQLEKELDISD